MLKKYSELCQERVLLKDTVPLETPFALHIEPTNWCNFKCTFCPRNNDDFINYVGSFCHMDLKLFSKILNEAKQFPEKIKVIRLYYLGEPLMHPNFIPMLKMLIAADITERIEISTNASLLTKELTEKILNVTQNFNGLLYMRYSIYSVIPSKNKKITKSFISPEIIYSNIANFQQRRNALKVKNVITYAKMLDSYDDENIKFLNLYNKIVDEAMIEQPHNWDSEDKRNLLADVYSSEQIEQINSLKMPKVCSFLFTTMCVLSDGTVVSCCIDWSRKNVIGNVLKNSLKEIWNGEKLKNLRLLHVKGQRSMLSACKYCKRLPCHPEDCLDDITAEILE